MNDVKKPWESKTILVNAIIGFCGALALFVPNAKFVSDFISSHGGEITMIWSILNIILRSISKDKIVLRD